jgi:two-component system, OmpR family, sensor histidine kinase CiaH
MFKSARIKLTLWYLAIIAAITLSFSSIMYLGISNTAERALQMHQLRIEKQLKRLPRYQQNMPRFQEPINEETVKDIKTRILIILGVVNGAILFIAGGLGYFLAGRTLAPIEQMIERQKKFVADAAHELKTPLTAMKTNLEVNLRKKDLKVKGAKEIISGTVADIDTLTSLTNSLLKQSKYQGGNHNSTKENVVLAQSVERVLKKLRPRIEKKELTVTRNLEKVALRGNKNALEELITILVDNAVKFNKQKGTILIELQERKDQICLKVKDTGIGIPKKDIPYIFDRFYKANSSRSKRKNEGFGLGLSIAKEIVKEHGGKIAACSDGGKETTVTVLLPKL